MKATQLPPSQATTPAGPWRPASLATLLILSLLALLGLSCSTEKQLEVSSGGLGPVAEGRQRLLREALFGLDFSSGRVQVTAPATSPADLATDLARSHRLLREGRFYEAIAAAAAAVRALPEEPAALEQLATALQSRHRLEEAEAALRTALDLSPTDPELRFHLATVLQTRRRLAEAIEQWQRILELFPSHGPSHARLAVAFFLSGETDRARFHAQLAEQLGHPAPPQLDLLLRGLAPKVGTRLRPETIAPPVRVDTGGTASAAETAIATGGTGQMLVAGWNDLRQAGAAGHWRLGVAASTDGGASWIDRIVRAPLGQSDDSEGDPMTAHDPRTGNQWVGGVLFGFVIQRPSQLFIARRQPGSNNFLTAVSINVATFVDKPLLTAGPRPGLPNTTRLYVTYNLGLQTSDDLGATWSAVRALDSGLALHPRLGPNGELYVIYWDINLQYRLLKSTDGGASFAPSRTVATRLDLWSTAESSHVPGRFRVPPIACLAVSPVDGTLYAVYPDSSGTVNGEENVDVFFTRSTNGGTSWSTPRVIHGDSTPPRDQFQPWLEVGGDGRLHLMFFDTRGTPQLDADANAFIDVYYATSLNRGEVWTEMRVTPQPFQSQLADWDNFEEQFVGDYSGLTVAGDQVDLLYPSTLDGDLDIYSQRLEVGVLFADGFESGDVSAWSVAVP